MKLLAATVLSFAVVQVTGVAVAADLSDEPAKQVVGYADLDLTHAAGAAILYGRIQAAARDVCAPFGPQSLATIVRDRRCADEAVARAIGDVNAPALTDYYTARTGQHPSAASRTLSHERRSVDGSGGSE